MAHGLLKRKEYTARIDGKHLIKLLLSDLAHRTSEWNACIRDDNIKVPKMREGLLKQVLNGTCFRQIRLQGKHRFSLGAQR